jgi:hypothetical protein
MQIFASDLAYMQREICIESQSAEKFLHELGVEFADLAALQARAIKYQKRAVGKIKRGAYGGFVHHDDAIAEALDVLRGIDRLFDRASEHYAAVLDAVVKIDLQIALAAQVQIDPRVLSKRAKHMIEKTDARLYLRCAAPVKLQLKLDFSLFRSPIFAYHCAILKTKFCLKSI